LSQGTTFCTLSPRDFW